MTTTPPVKRGRGRPRKVEVVEVAPEVEDYEIDASDTYRDNPLLKKAGVKIEYTQEQVDEYIKCAKDPVYFAENYVTIVNVDVGLMKFKMWPFQKDMIRTYQIGRAHV